jgi:hypothetical protein
MNRSFFLKRNFSLTIFCRKVLSTCDSGDVSLLDAATVGLCVSLYLLLQISSYSHLNRGTSSTTQQTDSVSEGGAESSGAASVDD